MVNLTDSQWPTDRILIREGIQCLRNSVAPPIRPISQFAEEEVILPNGPFAGQKYKLDRKPCSRLWFNEIESKRWWMHVYTGPVQSGKTLDGFVIPIMWCLFEKKEDVIVGLPDMNMSDRKWRKDILPCIERSQYASLLPSSGAGSKGGKVTHAEFANGANLTFMSFGGKDKSKAGDTAPNIIITESDGANEAGEASEEADPIEQLIARAAAFDLDAFVILECTVSVEDGQIWRRYINGTASRILRPCPLCGEYVAPEREHFYGWESAEDEIEAGEKARFHCPNCREAWSDARRFASNTNSILVHKGQEVVDGHVSGPIPRTRTLGFRYSAVDNSFRSSPMLGGMEWNAARARDRDNAEKGILQFQWTRPWIPEADDEPPVDPYEAAKRIGDTRQGVIPEGHDVLTIGVDLRNTQLHWTAIAWQPNGTCRIIDYGVLKVYSRRMGVERAIFRALQYFRDDVASHGWPIAGTDQNKLPDQVWIDAGYKSKTVFKFIRECQGYETWHEVFRPYVGRGALKQYQGRYADRPKASKNIPYVGEEFYISWQDEQQVALVLVNADAWKTFVHARLRTPLVSDDGESTPGALSLFVPSSGDHSEYCRHLCSESEHKEFHPDKGEITVWRTISRVNHWFDATYAACTAAKFCGIDVVEKPIASPPVTHRPEPEEIMDDLMMPDGRRLY